ncbi:MAG: phenylacetate--CoA ligase family protein [Ignavibacteriae bacterium]|nr:phenylacetate--CoA ligase family protein [Ignavibacteriota bacterium]
MLKNTPFWEMERIKSWQFQQIKKLITHAYNNVPFYNRLYSQISFEPEDLKTWNDFERLPVVTKDDVIENYPDNILKGGIKLDDLIVSRSSGSSGKVLDIAYDTKAMITYILAGLRLYKMGFNYKPWHKQVYVYTSPYPLNSLFGFYPLHFISTLSPQNEVIQALVKLKPALLVCYPSHFKQIAELASEEDRKKTRLKSISVNSEMSTQSERDYLSDLFNCPVLDEYSSEELTRIAAQCLHKKYHIFEDINYIEALNDNLKKTDEIGTIVGTNLHNFVMPMIRYKQDDRGQIKSIPCSCGWKFRTLTNFEGRKNDSFILPSGKILTSGFLLDATYDFLLSYRTAIRDYCLIQKTKNSIILQVVKGQNWNNEIHQEIIIKFQSFLEENVIFEIGLVEECEKTKSGKRNPIINMINRKN